MAHEDAKLSRSRAILLFFEHLFCVLCIYSNKELYRLYAFVSLN